MTSAWWCDSEKVTPRHQRGVTLVELMVGMAMGLLVSAGLFQAYLNTSQSYRFADQMARLQENGRFAVQWLSRELRMAGYSGCRSGTTPTNILEDTGPWYLDLARPLQAYEYGQALPGALVPHPDSDAVGVLLGQAGAAATVVSHDTANARLRLEQAPAFPEQTVVVVSDCIQTTVFRSTAAGSADPLDLGHREGGTWPGNRVALLGRPMVEGGAELPYTFDAGAQVMPLAASLFFVADKQVGGRTVPALYRLRGGAAEPDELVEGVDDLQILYGEDQDGDGLNLRYLPGDQVDMDQVVSLRLTLEMMAPGEGMDTAELRRTFTTTVALRNRTP